jgi:hypothetical protein
MRWVTYLVVLLLFLPAALAVTVSCPSNVEENEAFDVTVAHDGATQFSLYHHSNYDIKSGTDSYTYSLTETQSGTKTYLADAYTGGWLDANKVCVVTVDPHVDTAGSFSSFTVSPTELEVDGIAFHTISLQATFEDADNTDELQFLRNGAIIDTNACSGTTCYKSHSDTIRYAGTYNYKALGYDKDRNPTTSSTITVTATGVTSPTVSSLTATPNPVDEDSSTKFEVTVTDSGADLKRVYVVFGDGSSDWEACSGSSCSRNIYHTYTSPGTKAAYAYGTDLAGNTGPHFDLAVIVNGVDVDQDGIPDDDEHYCPDTETWDRPVVDSALDPYLGCGCNDIINLDPDPTRDDSVCTDDTCSIVSGAFVPVHTPLPDGSQPEGFHDGCVGLDLVDFFCQAGKVVNSTSVGDPECEDCDPNSYQDCWDGDPYWYDSCDNRDPNPIEICVPPETCVAAGATASCEDTGCTPACAGKSCGAPDGCLGFCDVESCPVGQSCEPSGSTFVCTATSCPETCVSQGYVCGSWVFCGEQVSCGSCSSGTCDAQGQCACVPDPLTTTCANIACGNVTNNCGVVVSCTDSCRADQVCSGNTCVCEFDECGGVCVDVLSDEAHCGSCDTVCGVGEFCAAGSCSAVRYAISFPNSLELVAGERARLDVSLVALDGGAVPNVYWEFSSWMGGCAGPTCVKDTTHADIPEQEVTVTALQLDTALVLAEETITFQIACDEDHAVFGPCCHDGSLLRDGQSSCDLDGVTGVCTENGCVEFCAPAVEKRCRDNSVWWFDSCGKKGDLVEECGDLVCDDAQCVSTPVPCDEPWVFACQGQDGVKTRCGVSMTVSSCAAGETCVATAEGIACETPACPRGETLCGSRCVDLASTRTDCGSCNAQCDSTELCTAGTCELIPGCFVACDDNDDCAAGHVCLDAGDCFSSRCEPTNVLDNRITTTELLDKDYLRISHVLEGDSFLFTLTNKAPVPLQDVSFTIDFPKVIAQDASQFFTDDAQITIIEQDPVLRFSLPEVATTRSIVVTVDHTLDASYESLISLVEYSHAPIDPALLEASWNETKEALHIGINKEFDGEKTTLHLSLDPTKSLFDLTVPVQIPKCMAEYASEMGLPDNVEILEEDPLIAWQFDQLDEPVAITFTVNKDIDQECLDQLKAMAFAQQVGKPLSPWLALLIIPALAVTLIFFQRFESGAAVKLSKREFFEVARGQGTSEAEIERQWREYQRRF